MSRFDGSLARTLDFGEAASSTAAASSRVPMHRLASLRPGASVRVLTPRRLGPASGPDKYTVLDRRRRAAQIKARRAMDLIDVMERAGERG
jgi:hypothetical protein